jgi:CHASE2 domain-containing sensor protein
MATIFLSYRREDGIARAGRIYDRLVSHFGEDKVFLDVSKITTGADFQQVLDRELESCELFIAIIGEHWLLSRKGRRRLDDPGDFVRREIERALERNVRILPVLVGEANMPGPHQLPPEIAEFARRNAVRVSDERFDVEMDSLILDIEDPDRAPEDTALAQWHRMQQHVRRRRLGLLTGAAMVALVSAMAVARPGDLLTLDTRLQTVSVWLADLVYQPAPDSRVAIIAIDNQTERRVGRSFDRSWRAEHAVLLDRLSQAGARAVVFDMYFEEPSGMADNWFRAALQRARDRHTEVFIGMRRLNNGVPHVIPAFRQHASGVGLLCVGSRLGYATTVPLVIGLRTSDSEGMAWQSLRFGLGFLAAFGGSTVVSLDEEERKLLIADGGRVREVWLGNLEAVQSRQPICPALRVRDETAQLIVRLSNISHWRRAPALVKYEDAVAPPLSIPVNWNGKIVLVGVTKASADAEGVEGSDVYKVLRGFNAEERFGVELHADAISNLLSSRQLHPLHWAGQLLFTVASVGTALFLRLAAMRLPRLLRWGLIASSVGAYILMVALLCAKFAVLLNAVYHLTAFFLTYWLLGKFPAFAARQGAIRWIGPR